MPDNDLRDALIAAIRDALNEATRSGVCFDSAKVATDTALDVIGNWDAGSEVE